MIQPQIIRIGKSPHFPQPILPVLVYKQVIPSDARGMDELFKQSFSDNEWRGVWSDTIYPHRHFHSNAHEALGIAKGDVTVELGADAGEILELSAGDLLVLPAGTVHRRLKGTADLTVIGAYPKGQTHYTMCTEKDKLRDVQEEIADVRLPESDPFYGEKGPLLDIWNDLT